MSALTDEQRAEVQAMLDKDITEYHTEIFLPYTEQVQDGFTKAGEAFKDLHKALVRALKKAGRQ